VTWKLLQLAYAKYVRGSEVCHEILSGVKVGGDEVHRKLCGAGCMST
jgi:hypothetical protein